MLLNALMLTLLDINTDFFYILIKTLQNRSVPCLNASVVIFASNLHVKIGKTN